MNSWKPLHTITIGSVSLIAAALLSPATTRSQNRGAPSNFVDSQNGNGVSRTLTTYPSFNTTGSFFQPLGTNGRTCATCHPITQGMTISPDYATQVFNATEGLDPLFAPIDGANSPAANMSTMQARRASCSMLLNKGLIRIGLGIPEKAEFTLAAVNDPYHYASASGLSCFRRPLPVTNLRFLATVMWDGRELAGQNSISAALASQAHDAVLGHEQASAPPTSAQISQILDFETHLYTSQILDNVVGNLNTPQIGAGPMNLLEIPFFSGINGAFGLVQDPRPFNPNVFDYYQLWLNPQSMPKPTPAQLSVARGEKLFNTRPFAITGVAGLNDITGKKSINGTCSSCHNTPGVGNNSLPLLLNTGIADGARRTPDMPLYTFRNKVTGTTIQTTDPGAALTTGKWADIGKFKVPSLRGLETQSPYMHNGFSGDLLDVIDFYDTRFSIGLSEQDKADLKAFLTTL